MIGEIRDEQTARLAITCALTGHLVLTTIHSSNCLTTIRRLLNDIPDGKNVLIVSHGGALMNFLRKALNSLHPLGKLHYHNCGIVVLNYDGQNFTLKSVASPADDVPDSYNDNL